MFKFSCLSLYCNYRNYIRIQRGKHYTTTATCTTIATASTTSATTTIILIIQ